ncbi:SGNH/GDSL hydrolase family protein [Thermodesulfobacteriota bacterium]
MKKKSHYQNILFPFIIFGMFFLFIELLAKVYLHVYPISYKAWYPEKIEGAIVSDLQFNHKWRSSLSIRIPARGSFNEIITNKESWLEKYEITKNKPPNVYRIFYLGDSTTQGVAEWDKSMVNILEKKLNQYYQGKPLIEIVNTGTSSYSTLIYYLLIRHKLLQYSPDLVVINIDMTDVTNDMLYRKRIVTDNQGLPIAVQPFELEDKKHFRMTPSGIIEISTLDKWNQFLYNNLSFYRCLDSLISKIHKEKPKIKLQAGWLPWHVKIDSSSNWLSKEWNSSIQANVDFSMGILRNSIELLQQNAIKVIFTGVPHYQQYTGELSSKPHEVLQEVSIQTDALYLNSYLSLKTKISGTKITKYYWSSDPTHFNNSGNEIWADAQYRFLMKHKGTIIP